MAKLEELLEQDRGNIIQSATGRFVIGRIRAAGDGSRGQIYGRLYNPSGQLVTVVSASVHHYNPSDANVFDNSFTLPVPAGWNYSVEQNITHSPCEVKFTTIEM